MRRTRERHRSKRLAGAGQRCLRIDGPARHVGSGFRWAYLKTIANRPGERLDSNLGECRGLQRPISQNQREQIIIEPVWLYAQVLFNRSADRVSLVRQNLKSVWATAMVVDSAARIVVWPGYGAARELDCKKRINAASMR